MRSTCIIGSCGKEQTDLQFITLQSDSDFRLHVGFPICDDHTIEDLTPDQYVMELIVEVH